MSESQPRPPSSPTDAGPDEPYCGNCGYVLKGLENSSKCPECGKPLVEILMRKGFAARFGKRYRSKATLFGLPVIDIAIGPSGGELRGKARGIIAIGDIARGWLAFGGLACGIVAVGGLAVGVFAIGGLGAGLLSAIGGMAASGGIAVGGGAVGTIAEGGGAVGVIAQGGGALGLFTRDGRSWGKPNPPVFDHLHWLLGGFPPTGISMFQPMLVVVGITVLAAAVIGLIAQWRLAREEDGTQSN